MFIPAFVVLSVLSSVEVSEQPGLQVIFLIFTCKDCAFKYRCTRKKGRQPKNFFVGILWLDLTPIMEKWVIAQDIYFDPLHDTSSI